MIKLPSGGLRIAHIAVIAALLLALAPASGPAAAQVAPPSPPVLLRAVPATGGTAIEGRLTAAPATAYTIAFFAAASCAALDAGGAPAGTATATTDAGGNASFAATIPPLPAGSFVTARATAPGGAVSDPAQCTPVGAGNDSWTRARELTLAGDPSSLMASAEEFIDKQGQSRWFRFRVTPGSKVIVSLTNLPAPYELAVYKDIAEAYATLTTPQDLVRLGAEFAPDAFSPDAFSPDAFSPDAFSPDAFSPDAFSPDAFSPDAFSPDAFSPDAFSPDAFSPDAFSPDAFSPDAFSPDAFSPDAFSPDAFSPDPAAFSSAQQRSLLGVSAFEGTAGQALSLNTWNNDTFFYVRVRGRNGAFSLDAPFRLDVTLVAEACAGVNPSLPATSTTASAGGYRTIILADLGRISGTPAQIATLQSRLAALAARPEVAGVVVPVGADARVAAANAQADALPQCPYAKNLVAESIDAIVDAYWDLNPLEYVVIIGNDDAIPFFRYPDGAAIGMEQNFVPPVRDGTSSQASLRLGFVLGQDAYGTRDEISDKTSSLPLANLAVGRLVETAAEISGMIDAYLATPNGVVPAPHSSLVTGYDFLEDAAQAIREEIAAGTGAAPDTLIAPRDISPEDRAAWTADQLRALLLGERHDLIFLAGHFSASSALAADYRTRLLASELAASDVDLTNAILWSVGCHSGYNIVDPHAIPGVTRQPDWAQAAAQKRMTSIMGTGYQYGDTDFIFYSERLYLEFSRQLRAGSGPVAVGKALAAAKRAYLTSAPPTRELFEKSYLIATLYGLPMLSVDMPGARLNLAPEPSVIGATNAFASDPGHTLGLTFADYTLTPHLAWNTRVLESTSAGDPTTVTANYISGSDGVLVAPGEPVLPLEMRNVGVHGTVLRGVGFRGGRYHDLPHITPLTGAATTELRAVHAPFLSEVLFPVRPWNVNYLEALADAEHGATRLAVTPAQIISEEPGSPRATLRAFTSMDFRLYYSNNTTTYHVSGNTPALAAPPAISRVEAVSDHEGNIHVSARVTGDPAAGIQEVWITYTATQGALHGTWESLNLKQNPHDSTLWEGVLDCGVPPSDLRYIVQAANGVGLVTLATNQGAFFTPNLNPGSPPMASQHPTELTLQAPHAAIEYGTPATFVAKLTSGGHPLAGQMVSFDVGGQRRAATTDHYGRASVTIIPLGEPGHIDARAAFAATHSFAGSSATASFEVKKQATALALAPAHATAPAGGESGVVATLTGFDHRPLGQQTVFFIVVCNDFPSDHYSTSEITDYAGRARLGEIPASLPAGNYTVHAFFLGNIPLPEGPLHLEDVRYLPAYASSALTITDGGSGGGGHHVDTTAPTTTPHVSGAAGHCEGCYTGNVTIAFEVNEPATTFYRVQPQGGAYGPWHNYGAPFVLSEEGINTVQFASVDAAGNIEPVRTIVVTIGGEAHDWHVLDRFDGGSSAFLSNWRGEGRRGYKVEGQRLAATSGGPIYWTPETFGANQEAFFTLTGTGGHFQSLLLKVQQGSWENGVIAVTYERSSATLKVETYEPGRDWKTIKAFGGINLKAGDRIAGRALANGQIQVYVNGALVGTAQTSFLAGKRGRIGVWYNGAPGPVLDDFGGGDSAP